MTDRKKRFIHRGDDAMKHLREEQEREEQRREQMGNRGPMRFYISKEEGGRGWQTHEVVFLDDDLTMAPHAYEHAVPGPNNDWTKTQNVTCIDEFANCPLCRAAENNEAEEFKPPRYQMYATVLDLTPYTIKRGKNAGQVRETTRKLMVIPMQMMETYKKMFELCKKQNGTTRGMVCLLTKKEKNDARCGEPQMIEETGMLFDFMSEDELDDYADEAVVREGKVVLEEGENIEPYEYEDLLEPKTEDELRRMFNLSPAAGSRAEADEESGGTRTRRRRSRSAPADAEDEAPARGRKSRRRSAAPADDEEDETPKPRRRSRARTQDADEEDSDGDADEDEAPRGRRSRRRRGGDDDVDIPFDG